MLIALAGLPGSGKSAIAGDLGRALCCAVLSVDPVEAAIWRAGVSKTEPTGLAGFREPDWADVQERRKEFAAWADARLTLDSLADREHNLRAALEYLGRPAG